MNKKFLAAVTMALISAFAVPTFAQCDKKCGKEKCATEKCDAKDGKKECKQDGKNHPCPFDNLNLTDKQKEQIKALKAEMKAKKKAAGQKAEKGGDEFLAKVKAILTPEQYVQFLENGFKGQRHGDMQKGKKGDKQCKQGKEGCQKHKNGKAQKSK